jgi:hypothetical protein
MLIFSTENTTLPALSPAPPINNPKSPGGGPRELIDELLNEICTDLAGPQEQSSHNHGQRAGINSCYGSVRSNVLQVEEGRLMP